MKQPLSIPRLGGLAAFSQPSQMDPSRHQGCGLELGSYVPCLQVAYFGGEGRQVHGNILSTVQYLLKCTPHSHSPHGFGCELGPTKGRVKFGGSKEREILLCGLVQTRAVL